MNNLIIKRSQLVEAQFTGTPAAGVKYAFTQVPNISRNNIIIYGFEVFTSGSILNGSVFNINWYTQHLGSEIVTPLTMILDSFKEPPVYFALAGIVVAWIFHRVDGLSAKFVIAIKPIYKIYKHVFVEAS